MKDRNGEALIGVNVAVKGTTSGAATDGSGNFTVTAPETGKIELVFTYIGYKKTTIATDGQHPTKITLEKDVTSLTEVVIGYQSIPKRDVTGAVSSLNAATALKDIPSNSAAEALTGRLAGVQITMSEGAPGAEPTINIRGRNSITQDGSPLYVVDGVQIDNALNTLSPQDIASIDVLKDASATAIYGARGSNGVIIITTKGGKNTGGKTTVTYNGFWGVQTLPTELPVMDPYDFVLYQYERAKVTGDTSAISRLGRTFDTLSAYKNIPYYNWQHKTMGRQALMQTHNVSLSGGTQATQYNLSLTSNQQEGLLLNSEYNRKLVNFRFDHKANDKLKFGFNTRYNYQVMKGAGTSDAAGAGSNRLRQFVRYRPFLLGGEQADFYDPNLATETNSNGMALINPIQLSNAEYRNRAINVINLNGYFQYNFTKQLSFRSTTGYDVNTTQNRSFDDTITNTAKTYANLPVASVNNMSRTTINNSNVLSYVNTALFKSKHSLNIILGEETYQTRTKNNYLEVRYFPAGLTADQAFANMNLGTAPSGAVQPKPTSSEVPVNSTSFFTRINYGFNDKYLATFTFRADGSSVFGDQNKWGYFPSSSLAWRISQESFMRSLHFISDLKVRLTFGSAGNNRIDPFSYKTQYSSTTGNGVIYGLNNLLVTGYAPQRLGNPDLKWETLISRNVGLDLALFNDRIQFTADYYYNTTKDLLVNIAVPTSSGYISQYQNVGSTLNKGLELQLSGLVLQQKSFSWNASFNISFNKNTIRKLGDQQSFLVNSGWFGSNNPADFIVKVGDEVGAMYGYVNDGYYKVSDFNTAPYSNTGYPLLNTAYTLKPDVPNVYPGVSSVIAQPGLSKFKDLNGDNLINDKDRTIIGRAQPKFFGGLSQQFGYKNFDLSIFLNFSYGNDVYNANKLEFAGAYTPGANLLSIMNDRWHVIDAQGNQVQRVISSQVAGIAPEELSALNPNPKYWQPVTGANAFYPQSFAIEDGSFIRINNLTLGYTLPGQLLKRIKVKTLRVYATANNLAVITGYSGYDPEANTRRNTPMTPGVDYSAYPRSRTFIMGVNLSL